MGEGTRVAAVEGAGRRYSCSRDDDRRGYTRDSPLSRQLRLPCQLGEPASLPHSIPLLFHRVLGPGGGSLSCDEEGIFAIAQIQCTGQYWLKRKHLGQ